MGILFTNNAEAELAAGITDIQTTNLQLKAGQGTQFPVVTASSGDYFYATLVDISGNREIIKVTEHQSGTDVFQQFERAADTIQNQPATALAFSTNDKLQARPNKKIFEEFEASIAANAAIAHNQNTDVGTNATQWQLDSGGSGPRLKNSSGTLQIRNAADSAFANLAAFGLTLTAALEMSSNAINGVTTLAMGGALTGVTTISASGQITCVGLAAGAGNISTTGTITSGAITASGSSNLAIDNESAAKSIKARDHGGGTTPEVGNVIFGTGSPPAANTVPVGTIFVKYTP